MLRVKKVIEVIEVMGQGVDEASEDRDDEGNHSTEGYDGMEEDCDVGEDHVVGEDQIVEEDRGVEGHLDDGGDE